MIFLTVGTQDPYDRLVAAVDDWAISRGRGAEVFGQITDRANYRPASFETTGHLNPEAFQARCREADVIVGHAGMGTIITSMSLGKQLVVMPRRVHLGEQRNDHQWATAHRFRDRAGIHVAMSEVELPEVIDSVLNAAVVSGVSLPPFANARLIRALRKFVFES